MIYAERPRISNEGYSDRSVGKETLSAAHIGIQIAGPAGRPSILQHSLSQTLVPDTWVAPPTGFDVVYHGLSANGHLFTGVSTCLRLLQ